MSLDLSTILAEPKLIKALTVADRQLVLNQITSIRDVKKFVRVPIPDMVQDQIDMTMSILGGGVAVAKFPVEILILCIMNGLKIPYRRGTTQIYSQSPCYAHTTFKSNICFHDVLYHPKHIEGHPNLSELQSRCRDERLIYCPGSPNSVKFYLDNCSNPSLAKFRSIFKINNYSCTKALVSYCIFSGLNFADLHREFELSYPGQHRYLESVFHRFPNRQTPDSKPMQSEIVPLRHIFATPNDADVKSTLCAIRIRWLKLSKLTVDPNYSTWKDYIEHQENTKNLRNFRKLALLIEEIPDDTIDIVILKYPTDLHTFVAKIAPEW